MAAPLLHATHAATFQSHRVLLLNGDYRPFGFPLITLTAQEAIAALYLDRVHVVRNSNVTAHSPSMEMQLPSVVALKSFIHVPGMNGAPQLNRHNLFVRDRGRCLYTGKPLSLKSTDKAKTATIDHVHPTARGGEHGWHNCVMSSMTANLTKGCRTPEEAEMPLIHQPWQPTASDLLYLWLTDERLANLEDDWLEFLSLTCSSRVERFLEKLDKAA